MGAPRDHDEFVASQFGTANRLRDQLRERDLLLDSYRILTRNLATSAENIHREHAGLTPKPVGCTVQHPTQELVCLLDSGHKGAHRHDAGSRAVSWG
jgi:hypothetical protein